jgi:hypothetical protein
MAWVATAIVGSGVLSAASTAYAANKASQAQVGAANTAANTALSMYNTTNTNLAPYRAIGQTAATDLTNQLPTLTAPITMDEATLQQTPGYQFNLTQGEKAVQNSAAARGLGSSGAALKGAATFATGLADNTYQNQFQNAVTNQTNAYNRLKGLVDTGANAAAGTGQAGTAAANTAASAQIGAGNAQAAGINQTAAGVNNAANNIAGYAAYKGLYGSSSGSGAPLQSQTGLNYGANGQPIANPTYAA